MNLTEVRRWALKGAEQRLAEIAGEANAILRNFPELRGKGRGLAGTGSAATRQVDAGIRRRPRVSAAARKAASDRMKKYWAARREGRQSHSSSPADRPRGPRTMSADARARISAAQKARWAKVRADKAGAAQTPQRARKKR